MTLGIFHKVFEPQTLEQSLDGACAAGLVAVQLDLTAVGLDPAELSVEDGVRIQNPITPFTASPCRSVSCLYKMLIHNELDTP